MTLDCKLALADAVCLWKRFSHSSRLLTARLFNNMAENLTKSALAQFVLPETMDDIEEYLKPEFPLKHQRRKVKEQDKDGEDEVHGRRIVMDGFGRWREVRPKKHIQSKRLELVDAASLPRMKQVFGMESPSSSRCGSNTPTQKSRYDAYRSHGEATRY